MRRIATIVGIVGLLGITGCGSSEPRTKTVTRTETPQKLEPQACQNHEPIACEEATHEGELERTHKEVQELGEKVEGE